MDRFIKDESGAEVIEYLTVLAITAGLIAIAYSVAKKLKTRQKDVADAV